MADDLSPAERASWSRLCYRYEARIKALESALRPFARIKPSTFYPEDGSEAEPYCVLIAPPKGNPVEFTGADLARARNALKGTDNG